MRRKDYIKSKQAYEIPNNSCRLAVSVIKEPARREKLWIRGERRLATLRTPNKDECLD